MRKVLPDLSVNCAPVLPWFQYQSPSGPIYTVPKMLGQTQIKATQRYSPLKESTLLAATEIAASQLGLNTVLQKVPATPENA